ncbi:hypothetical protein ASD86_09240 [Lysobacter sp. Root690]|nr:hypothetical protein ASD86_09240 [Lysobacter sp. Root690]
MEGNVSQSSAHSAEAAALGFYYQALFGLATLVEQTSDEAAVAIERLDDVEIVVDGNTLLYQLKHSLSAAPPPVTIASRALWKTVKVWIDLLPNLSLSETTLHLVVVGSIPSGSPLTSLLVSGSDRGALLEAMQKEAGRVIDERIAAEQAGVKKLPHDDRANGCEAFFELGATEKLNLLRRMRVQQGSDTIDKIETRVAGSLSLLPMAHRPMIARRLVEWWDRQVLYSLCGKRERFITRIELQHQITEILGDIEEERLIPDFMTAIPPKDYQPNGMIARQIELVEGRDHDLTVAIREEWRARAQRSKWINENPAMASVINEYDLLLRERWSDRHIPIVDECSDALEPYKREAGLKLLRWAHHEAAAAVPAISAGWSGQYYVSGSFQVLAIGLEVGWHPDYRNLLKEEK